MGVTEFKLLSLVVVVVEKWRNSISAVLKLYLYKLTLKTSPNTRACGARFLLLQKYDYHHQTNNCREKRTRNKPELLGEMKEE